MPKVIDKIAHHRAWSSLLSVTSVKAAARCHIPALGERLALNSQPCCLHLKNAGVSCVPQHPQL